MLRISIRRIVIRQIPSLPDQNFLGLSLLEKFRCMELRIAHNFDSPSPVVVKTRFVTNLFAKYHFTELRFRRTQIDRLPTCRISFHQKLVSLNLLSKISIRVSSTRSILVHQNVASQNTILFDRIPVQ